MLPPAVQQKLDALPDRPGVYVFRDHAGERLYVGKAASLRSRVRSYFLRGSSDERYFIARLPQELGDIETFVTDSEKEAALLENGLIKEYQPRYNIKLRDDKEYLSLRLDTKQAWPRLEVVRRPRKDGARYFGPYHSASAARSTLRVVNRHFQLRTCTDRELGSRTRTCLQYQIKRCPGPCVYTDIEATYDASVRNVGLFLEGRHDELLGHLRGAMADSAESMKYELAAVYRDQIRAVESTQQDQRVSLVTDVDQDVFGYLRHGTQAEVAVLMARRGRVIGVRTFALRDVHVPDDELMGAFVREYYGRGSFLPGEVLLGIGVEAGDGLSEVLSEQAGHRVKLLHPQRGSKAKLVHMAMDNAAHAYREKSRQQEEVSERLHQVQKRLSLPTLPVRFECIDISHTGGQDTVAAVVAFDNGEPDRRRYRSFRVRTVDGGDDYGAIHEVLSRRFLRAQKGDAGWELPDLLVVDGGKGQLGMALRAMEEIGVSLPIVGLAKEKENALGQQLVDRIYLPGRMNAIELRSAGRALSMLAHARDEAHRASNALRVKVGAKRQFRSGLDDVQGVGPKTRTLLLKRLGSLQATMAADEQTLRGAGATARQAARIYAHFHDDAADSAHAEQEALEHAFEALDGDGDGDGDSEGDVAPAAASKAPADATSDAPVRQD